MIYYPELNEAPAVRMFETSYNFGDSYSITWALSRDAEAREVLRNLRIRALKCCPIRPEILGDWTPLNTLNEDGFSCLISGNAHSKLIDADLCSHKMYLD